MQKQTNKTKKTAIKAKVAPKALPKKVVATKAISKPRSTQSDGPYLIKLTLFALLGLMWIKISKSGSTLNIPIPIGFIVGLIFTSHERFKIDRKIEYAVLLAALLVGFIAPFGLYVNF